MIYKTDAELQAACEHWQKVLRLQDWDVKCFIARADDLDGDYTAGEVDWTYMNKQAVIRVVDPQDWPDDTNWDQDMEETLVHELLHLHAATFDTFKRGGAKHAGLEQMIVAVSEALVALHRGGEAEMNEDRIQDIVREIKINRATGQGEIFPSSFHEDLTQVEQLEVLHRIDQE